MKRALLKTLEKWRHGKHRKPIVLKGARQVGKSYLARQLGSEFSQFVEVNFDYQKELKSVFERDLDPERITRELSLALGTSIVEGKTLLFLDEIQECPEAIKSLRYFYERMPQLHVIAAGSLMDFALEHTGLPVGRVMPLHLYPLSFVEFLEAANERLLADELASQDPANPMADIVHEKLTRLLFEFLAIGGMPEAVNAWLTDKDLDVVREIRRSLIETYRQDFAKYATSRQIAYVDAVYSGVPGFLGSKLVFSKFGSEYRSRELKPALELLSKAQVLHKVVHSSCGGIPLAGQSNPHFYKVIICDVGLTQTMLSLDSARWILSPESTLTAAGPIVESFVGQEILAYSSPSERIQLYYWAREKRGSNAEIDYAVERSGSVLPIEVKAKTARHMKSLHIFLDEKRHIQTGIVFSRRNFKQVGNIKYYPLYAVSRLFQRPPA